MDYAVKKTFKSSSKHMPRISAGGGGTDSSHEEFPILLDHDPVDDHQIHHHHQSSSALDPSDHREVIVEVDASDSSRPMDPNGAKNWRESGHDKSFSFQKSVNETSLDLDLEMEDLSLHDRNLDSTPASRVSKELKVSFQTDATGFNSHNDSFRRRYRDSQDSEENQEGQRYDRRRSSNFGVGQIDSDAEVLRCTSNAAFQRDVSYKENSILLRAKTKSRLMDPPEEPGRRSGRIPKSGPMRSGLLGQTDEDPDDDPFFEDDIPDEYKRAKFNVWTLIQLLSLILMIGVLVCTLSIPYLRGKILWKLDLWKWEVMILVLICGRLVSGWGIRIIVFFVERNFLLRKRVLYFVYGVRTAVQNCLWLALVLISWYLLLYKNVEEETESELLRYVTKILICLLVGTIIWLVKTLVVKVLASCFHVSTYFDRIQESLFYQYVIETLSGPPLIEIQKNEEEERRLLDDVRKLQNAGATIPPDLKAAAFSSLKSGRVIRNGGLQKGPQGRSIKYSAGEEGITIDHLHKLSPQNISAWNMKRLMNIVRHGALSTLDEQIQDSSLDDESATQIRSEVEAKAAARKIFLNVARPGSKYIYIEDLMRFMRDDEALKTMSLFEGAPESQKINRRALKTWVVNAFRERRALALTLNDTKTAVNKLNRVLDVVVGIAIIITWVIILGIATTQFLVYASSQFVVLAFVFGNTCKIVFESIIFLFVIHPYDVGDRCEIDGVQMIVEEMNILTTVFLRFDNQKIIYPNVTLAAKAIHNYYRSPDMWDSIEFCVHIATPAEKIALIRQRIESFMDNKKEHWCPSPQIVFKDVEGFDKIKIAVWPTHRMNHQDMTERWNRRSILIEEMVKIFRELDIYYRMIPRDINICSMPPLALPANSTSPPSS